VKRLTIVIPCLHEKLLLASRIKTILGKLQYPDRTHIVVVDAFFDSASSEDVKSLGVQYVSTEFAQRSKQLNMGAQVATEGTILFFLHIDSTPPQYFDTLIRQSLNAGAESGCFRLSFDDGGWFLSSFAWFSRFAWPLARGGDQGLFVTPGAFQAVGGFRSDFPVMEDVEICRLLLRRKTFVIRPEKVITSARKYKRVGVVKLQTIFAFMHLYYWLGRPIGEVHAVYRKFIH
jgi:hypothetical protein